MTPRRPHRGDVWWADVPGDKRRPVLVLTRDRFISRLHTVLVAPVTTRLRHIPTEVELSLAEGLPQECAANFDNVFTLRKECLVELAGQLHKDRLNEVCAAYRFAAGC